MITDAFINVLLALPVLLLKALPNFSISFDDSVFDTLSNILQLVAYIIPVGGLLPILVISFALTAFKISWAITLRIKSFIPTMGN